MKLIDVLSEAREDVLIQKGKNVYEFLKHGTFRMRYLRGNVDLSYRYTFPDHYGVGISRGGGRRDYKGNLYGDRPLISIPAKEDESWVDPKYTFLFEPLDEISEKFLITDSDSVQANFRQHMENHLFEPRRVEFKCPRILIKMEFEGKIDAAYKFQSKYTKDVLNKLKEGHIHFEGDDQTQGFSFTYKLPKEVAFSNTDVLVTGKLEYNFTGENPGVTNQQIQKLITKEFRKEGVHLTFKQ